MLLWSILWDHRMYSASINCDAFGNACCDLHLLTGTEWCTFVNILSSSIILAFHSLWIGNFEIHFLQRLMLSRKWNRSSWHRNWHEKYQKQSFPNNALSELIFFFGGGNSKGIYYFYRKIIFLHLAASSKNNLVIDNHKHSLFIDEMPSTGDSNQMNLLKCLQYLHRTENFFHPSCVQGGFLLHWYLGTWKPWR